MALVRWRLDDPFTSDSFTFFRNPEEDGEPSHELTMSSQPTTAADGSFYFFAGAAKPRERNWTFKVFSKAERAAWEAWLGISKPYQVQLTTDLGDVAWIVIDRWSVKRKRSMMHELHVEITVHAFEVPAA